MKIAKAIGLALALSSLVAVVPIAANADRGGDRDRHGDGRGFHGDDHGFHEDRHGFHGDIRVFHVHDFPRWRAGFWHHSFHDGRWGWWWVVGSMWYFYPYAVYPYPDPYTPPVVVVQQGTPPAQAPPAPVQYWYYCESAKSYYPYVPSCPGGWKTVPATPQGAPAQ
jgi:hypothetical protein